MKPLPASPGLCVLLGIVFTSLAAPAHVPVPDSVLHPATAAEAWNVLRLSTANTGRLLRENRLAEIPDQISLCSPALRALPGFTGSPGARQTVTAGTIHAAVSITSLAQGALAGDAAFTGQCLRTLQADLETLGASFDPATRRADIFVCPMHPDCVSTDPAIRCAKCGMTLLPRRIPYSFVFTPPGEPTLRLTTVSPAPLTVGQPARVTLHLAHPDGSPVVSADLLVVHTQPIHLLIIDGTLGDYHHEHPVPADHPGDFTFGFTPARAGSYRVFADLVPASTGVQEYPSVDLPAGTVPFGVDLPVEVPGTEATVDGLSFRLDWMTADATPPRANQGQALRITVHGPGGQPLTALEPVMGAYAHLVGFYDDGHTVVHLHPAGAEASDPLLRGGPALEFKFYPPKPGFLRLYCQVQFQGRQIFAPFGVNVRP